MNTVPDQTTMSLHDIAAKLWGHGEREAYFNLLRYIEIHDQIADSLRELIVNVSKRKDPGEESEAEFQSRALHEEQPG